jgi:hypothetical protein
MNGFDRQAHWQQVYTEKVSLELIEAVDAKPSSAIVDIGGGASRLVDVLVEKGFRDLTVLDLSESAVSIAKMRLRHRAAMVKWIVADVTQWEPTSAYDLWHDRAAFHFLTEVPRCLRSHSRWSIYAATTTKPRGAPFNIFSLASSSACNRSDPASVLGCRQGLVEVGDDIVLILDADR